MFVGHLALGLAAKRPAHTVGLAWLVAAVITADLAWPVFLLLGIETVRIVPGATAFNPLVFDSYPWSHSLVMGVAWGVALATLARWRGVVGFPSMLIVVLVLSHWLLDFVTHAPDMPLWPGPSPHFGLGLWNSIPGTFVVEGAMWIVGIAVYLRTNPLRGWGSYVAFWSFVVICTAMWGASPWSPPPPNADALGWFALGGWLMIPWAALADRRPTNVT